MKILGFDIGGTGIKAAVVDTLTGTLLTKRERIETPSVSTPENMLKAIDELLAFFKWQGPVGCGFPGVVKNGQIVSAANLDKAWIGYNLVEFFNNKHGIDVHIINDADAAGIAEVTLGAGKGVKGSIIMITIGTGLGSALFHDGMLYPNTELGHLKIWGGDAEAKASAVSRKQKGLSWQEWAQLFDEYLDYISKLFSPDLIILGGGASKKADQFLHFLRHRYTIVCAQFKNNAGIIGAALEAKNALLSG